MCVCIYIYIWNYKVSRIGRKIAQMHVDRACLEQGFRSARKVDRQDPGPCIHDHLRDA